LNQLQLKKISKVKIKKGIWSAQTDKIKSQLTFNFDGCSHEDFFNVTGGYKCCLKAFITTAQIYFQDLKIIN